MTRLRRSSLLASLVLTGLAPAVWAQEASPTPSAPPLPIPAAPAPAAETTAPALASDAAAANGPPPAVAGDAAAGDPEGDATPDAEVAALIAKASESSSGTEKRGIDVYGFADFTYTHILTSKSVFQYPYESFAVGHLNVYAGSELGDDWRWLSEVRFMYLPDGATSAQSPFDPNPVRNDTRVQDYTDFYRPVKWGGISVERVHIEHMFHPLLTLRFGNFLTPYGIWNVDHGSPVIVPVTRPYPIGTELFPQHQTGIEAYGAWTQDSTQLGYHLTLSNGRGPIDTYQDLDHNKAIGGRLFLRQDTPIGTFTLGGSAYRGDYSDRAKQTLPDASGNLVSSYSVVQQYRELSLAADLKWEWQGLLVQAEILTNGAAYSTGHRTVDQLGQLSFPGPPGLGADYSRTGYYALLGYRTPFWGIMPYVFAEGTREGNTGVTSQAVRGGLNIRYTPQVVVKAEFFHVWFSEAPEVFFQPGNQLILQLAWSF